MCVKQKFNDHGCKKPVAEVAVLPEKILTEPKIFGKIQKIYEIVKNRSFLRLDNL